MISAGYVTKVIAIPLLKRSIMFARAPHSQDPLTLVDKLLMLHPWVLCACVTVSVLRPARAGQHVLTCLD